MDICLKVFQPSDYDAAITLWHTSSTPINASDERGPIERFLQRNEGLSFVAYQGHALVGTILCGHDGRRGFIHHLVVSPACKRHGVGKQLLHAGLAGLQAQAIPMCHVLVFKTNAQGLGFWAAVSAKQRDEFALFSLETGVAR